MAGTNTALDGSGTVRWLQADASGYLKVIYQAGAGAGGVLVDDAAFTPATSEVVVIGGFADEAAPDSVDEGDVGGVRMSLDRMLLTQTSGRAAEDAAVAGNPALVGGRYDAAARTLDDGDVGALALDAAGRPNVVGAVAEDAAVIGNPVLIGGRYDATARTLDDGDAGALALDLAGNVLIAGSGISISQTPTVTAGAYDANDAVGGLLTFANAARVTGKGGRIKSLILLDDAGQDAEMELWLFNATFTAMADNAAWAPSEADLRKLVGIVTTAGGAWFAAGTPSAARVEVSQRYDLAGTSLFGQLVTIGTPTFAATDDVTVIIRLETD